MVRTRPRLSMSFHQLPIPETLWDVVGDNLATLRARGLTVPLADMVIAALAMENDLEAWSSDPHFTAIQRFLPKLKLYQPPR